MGQKFCNVNIYGISLEEVISKIPDLQAYRVTEQWVTVVSPSFQWGSTQGYAQDISKRLSRPVLSTEFFDDDYVEFALYSDGKLVTKHIPVTYEGFRRKKGNAAKIIGCLSRNIMEEAALKKALDVSDCEESVSLMESYLGCPIYGISDDSPPIDAPDRTVFDAFAGGKTEVTVELRKNPARATDPPYAMELDTVFIPRTERLESVICFTDKPESIIHKIEAMIKGYREEEEWRGYSGGRDILKDYDIRIFMGNRCVVMQGLNYGSWADDASKDFKSLTMIVLTYANGFRRLLQCTMGYGGKCLFDACRSTKDFNLPSVIPNILLDSPFLKLADGELAAAFETPGIDDAVSALEKLLDAPLRPIQPEDYELVKVGDHLRVFRLR